MLSDRDIRAAVNRRDIVVEPMPRVVQPSSVDVTLGSALRVAKASTDWPKTVPGAGMPGKYWSGVDPTKANDDLWYDYPLNQGRLYVMSPGAFLLAHTAETVTLGPSHGAYIDGKSTLARNGLSVHVTAGFIDPGFHGQITLELANVAPWPLKLRLGMPIGQLVFHKMSSPVEQPYGRQALGSKYQGQMGATLARDRQED